MWIEKEDLDNRMVVLGSALKIEYLINQLLGQILDIECENSKTLGNKSTSLSLNQKVLILLDLKIIEPKEKEKIENFMGVRNQFMHNLNTSSFEIYFDNNVSAKNWFKKNYPIEINNITNEEKYKKAFLNLSLDVHSIILKRNITSAIIKCSKEHISKLEIKYKSVLEETYFKIFETLPASLVCFLNEGKSIDNIEEFVNGLKEKYNKELIKKFKENE